MGRPGRILSRSSQTTETTFGIGAKYALDKDAWVRAKVNNSSQVGLGYQQRLRDGKFHAKISISELTVFQD